eukprot:scaffold91848_cov27-Tisochrysis_lutea.AAC.3
MAHGLPRTGWCALARVPPRCDARKKEEAEEGRRWVIDAASGAARGRGFLAEEEEEEEGPDGEALREASSSCSSRSCRERCAIVASRARSVASSSSTRPISTPTRGAFERAVSPALSRSLGLPTPCCSSRLRSLHLLSTLLQARMEINRGKFCVEIQ